MKNNEPASSGKERRKKPYQEPHLQVYGDLREITGATLLGMTQDSSKGKANKTTP
jgi:hypothetical protein